MHVQSVVVRTEQDTDDISNMKVAELKTIVKLHGLVVPPHASAPTLRVQLRSFFEDDKKAAESLQLREAKTQPQKVRFRYVAFVLEILTVILGGRRTLHPR